MVDLTSLRHGHSRPSGPAVAIQAFSRVLKTESPRPLRGLVMTNERILTKTQSLSRERNDPALNIHMRNYCSASQMSSIGWVISALTITELSKAPNNLGGGPS